MKFRKFEVFLEIFNFELEEKKLVFFFVINLDEERELQAILIPAIKKNLIRREWGQQTNKIKGKR